MPLTEVDKQFFQALKAKGYSKEQATQAWLKAKKDHAAKASPTVSMVQGIIDKQAPVVELKKTSPTVGIVADQVQGAQNAEAQDKKAEYEAALKYTGNPEDAAKAIEEPSPAQTAISSVKEGGSTALSGAKDIVGGFVNPDAEAGLNQTGEGFNKLVGGTLGAVGAVPGAVLSAVPGGETVGQALTPSTYTDFAVEHIGKLAGATPEQMAMWKESLGNAANIGGLIVGPKAAKEGAKIVKSGASTVKKTVKPMIKKTQEIVKDIEKSKQIKNTSRADSLVGEIVQGRPQDLPVAKKALSEIDTKGVKTYKDLVNRMDEKTKSLMKEVDEAVSINDTPKPIDSFTKEITMSPKVKEGTLVADGQAGGRGVRVNYVKRAINQLEELYGKTLATEKLLEIQTLKDKAIKDGLTIKEVNDLARTYGTEFGKKAFGKTGEPLTSINAQAFENTRKGIKETARSFLPTDAAKLLDEQISSIISTKELVKKMEIKTNALLQKVKKRGLVESVARALGRAVDVATLGSVRGFVTSFLPSNIGNKVLNSLDLEQALGKNLKKLDSLLKKAEQLSDADLIKETKSLVEIA